MLGYIVIVFLILLITTSAGNALISSLSDFNALTSSLSSKFKKTLSSTSLKLQQSYILSDDLKNTIDNGPIDIKDRQFVINGWRWHTASVLRDIKRFSLILQDIELSLSSKSSSSSSLMITKLDQINGCHKFLCDFNWKALMRVESELFFPWLLEILPLSAKPLIQDLLNQHTTIRIISNKVNDMCILLYKNNANNTLKQSDIRNIDNLLTDMMNCALKIQTAQEYVFVPYIASFISIKEQERFNRRVISRLGLLDSQIHIVSMVEAIKDQPKEMKKFKEQIPIVAQKLIPIWRRRLYKPKAECLEVTKEVLV